MCVEENAIFRVTLLVSGEIVFDEDHGMWGTIEYTLCILCDTVGFRRSFWIAVVGSPLSPASSFDFFKCEKSVFVLFSYVKTAFLLQHSQEYWSSVEPTGFGEPHYTVVLEGPLDKLGTFEYVPLGPRRWLSTFYVFSPLPSSLTTQ